MRNLYKAAVARCISDGLILPVLCLIMLLIIPIGLDAQRSYRVIDSRAYLKAEENANPQIRIKRDHIETYIQKAVKKGVEVDNAIIPVVFHILYNNADQRIETSEIMTQLDALNRDFGGHAKMIEHQGLTETGYQSRKSSVDIEFCLATANPDGLPVDGIQYYEVGITGWQPNNDMKLPGKGGIQAWDTDKYLNIWVAALNGKISGYSQMPGGSPLTDGIVIDYRFLGSGKPGFSEYNQGRTLTHLTGNYLGLFSLWGNDHCEDDKVSDTPVHNAPNMGCPKYKHVSTCDGKTIEMTMNFMDNSDDECLCMFTAGQRARIHAVLSEEGPRSNLLSGETFCDEKILSLEESVEGQLEITLYPNPVHSTLFIDVRDKENEPLELEVYTTDHKSVYRRELSGSYSANYAIDTEGWNNGLYIFLFRRDGKVVFAKNVAVVKQ